VKRVATAVALAIPALAIVVWAPQWLFTALLAALALLAAHEFFRLGQALAIAPYRLLGFLLTAVFVVALALPLDGQAWIAVLVAAWLVLLVRALAQPERIGPAATDAAFTLLGAGYCGLLLGLIGAIRQFPMGDLWVLFLLAVVWVGDIAALYVGRAGGRHPMAPRVSPKKSWEGAIASFVTAILVGAACGVWVAFPTHHRPIIELALLGGAVNIGAQVGDLVESLLKRGAKVKDSGTLLPGHGGLLDRIDALLFAAPVVWYYVASFRR
jgi:phosphatidate cytidylyltransferase